METEKDRALKVLSEAFVIASAELRAYKEQNEILSKALETANGTIKELNSLIAMRMGLTIAPEQKESNKRSNQKAKVIAFKR